MPVIWFGLMMYEMTYCGAAIGGIIGGVAGFRINKKVVRKAAEILEQIEELQK